jgi:SWI/SNF-related matrix-associated actin-dependent regulator of chromatin subfamily A member 5
VTFHPYLLDSAVRLLHLRHSPCITQAHFRNTPLPPNTTDEHLIQNSGTMIILDKLLTSMKAKGSHVLTLSQMSRVLDILEVYCLFRQYSKFILWSESAGSLISLNKPGGDKFIFLLTTHAGGLGITTATGTPMMGCLCSTLTSSLPMNPQADLQAMDRAHRIGRTKEVHVSRFITENSVEERMLECAAQKVCLDSGPVGSSGKDGNSRKVSLLCMLVCILLICTSCRTC